ncbi:MAG: hypothetical protein OXI87_14260 [Albidovulum sp.]|nr:hypothetical protein [Albidovulum sp.]MDE0534057.1 hypothetical protein [Albidovulum sp.]
MNLAVAALAFVFNAECPGCEAALGALGRLLDRVALIPTAGIAQVFVLFACLLASAVSAARSGAAGVARLEPNAVRRIRSIPWVALAGSISGAGIAISQLGFPLQAKASPFLWIFLGAFLSAASYVDARTFWAPDELVLPCCVLAGSAGIADCAGYWAIWGPLSGLLLWGSARIAWRLQILFKRRLLPPPDIVAVAMPLLLFGADVRAVLAQFGCAAVLLGIGLHGSRSIRFRDRRIFACNSSLLGGRAVPFLAIAFPVSLLAGLIQ